MATHKRKHEVKLRQDTSVRTFTEDELKRVHYVYVQMASRIVSVCTANGILIMLSGGSALGAVRHQGFIPWDDDMDMNIPRRDFESLKEHFDDLFRGEYLLSAPNYYRHSGYRLAKIENPDVMICDEDGKTHGLRIDLFIIEDLPDSGIRRFFRGIRCEMIRIIAGTVLEYERIRRQNADCSIKKSPGDRMICFGGRIFSFRNSEEWFDLVDRINRFDNQGSRFVGIPGGRNHYFAEIYPREWLFRTVPALFEGQELPVPESCDLYLGKLYGDYMTIPQEEDREHHFIRSVSFRQGV